MVFLLVDGMSGELRSPVKPKRSGGLVAAQAQGIKVPEQLAIVGLGDLSFSRDLNPPLTTVRIDGAKIGAMAARFIVERSQDREVRDGIVDIGFSIIERDSA